MKTKRTRGATQRSRLGQRQLETLIEEAITDAYGESEQRVGFITMLEEHLAVPFATVLTRKLWLWNRLDRGRATL